MGKDDAVDSEEQTVVCLLPGYDEYLLGYKDRNAVLEAKHAPLIVPCNNGVFAPLLVVGGEAAGTWKRERVIEAARRYCEFVSRHHRHGFSFYSRYVNLYITKISNHKEVVPYDNE